MPGNPGVTLEEILRGSQPIESIKRSGLYALLHDSEIVYIGQASNIYKRIHQHLDMAIKVFNRYTIIDVPDSVAPLDLNNYETTLIIRYKPLYNKYLPSNTLYMSHIQLYQRYFVSKTDLKKLIKCGMLEPHYIKSMIYFPIAQVLGHFGARNA